MYIHLGQGTVVRSRDVVGIFDLESSTVSKHTRKFLNNAEKAGEVITVSYELPKSFVLTSEYGFNRVRLTSLNAMTLEKRLKSVP